jgi:hypothetical protein
MRTARRSAAVLTISAAFGVPWITAGGAAAATSIQASGTITVVDNVADTVAQAGQNVKAHATAHVAFDGTLAGPATEIYSALTHADGSVILHGKGSFTGTVEGHSGTLTYVFRGVADSGRIVITGGSGGLEGIHGQLPYELNTTTGVYTYSGTVRLT